TEDEQWLENYNANWRSPHAPLTELQFERIAAVIQREMITKGGYASVQTVQHMLRFYAYNETVTGVTDDGGRALPLLSDIVAVRNYFMKKTERKLQHVKLSEDRKVAMALEYDAMQRMRLEFERL